MGFPVTPGPNFCFVDLLGEGYRKMRFKSERGVGTTSLTLPFPEVLSLLQSLLEIGLVAFFLLLFPVTFYLKQSCEHRQVVFRDSRCEGKCPLYPCSQRRKVVRCC